MQKPIAVLALAIVYYTAMGQNYTSVVLNYSTGKMEAAKGDVDKLLASPSAAAKAETWFWKLNVYSELYADPALSPKYPDAYSQAMDGLSNYASKDPGLKQLKEYGLRPLSLLYSQTFNEGRDQFQKQAFEKAFISFSNCQRVSEFIGTNGLSSSGKYTIDTTVVLYAGYAAQNAGREAEATKRYKALADWNIADAEYKSIYVYILDYDTRQRDETSFRKYLAKAQKLYPAEAATWKALETNYAMAAMSLPDMISTYKREVAKGKMTEDDLVTYAEAFAMPDSKQLAQLDSVQQYDLKLLAADAFGKAYAIRNYGLYAFNAGILYYGLFLVLDDRYAGIKGASPAQINEKKQIATKQAELAHKGVDWLEKAYIQLKAKNPREKNESSSLNRSVDYLADLYVWLRDNAGPDNAKVFDACNEKLKFYSAEHGKYKAVN